MQHQTHDHLQNAELEAQRRTWDEPVRDFSLYLTFVNDDENRGHPPHLAIDYIPWLTSCRYRPF